MIQSDGKILVSANVNTIGGDSLLLLARYWPYEGNLLYRGCCQTFEGRLLLNSVALILYAGGNNVMRREGLNRILSVQELMYELKKIKLIHLGENGYP